MSVSKIAKYHDFALEKTRFLGKLTEGTLASKRVLILKPQTFMNESGRCVVEALNFYKGSPESVIVFHDELDLQPGKMRTKLGGGLAGHNGLKSIANHIGKNFRRVRLGIGHPGKAEDVSKYVLNDFSEDDQTWLKPLLIGIADAAPFLVKGDNAGFTNLVGLRTNESTTNCSPFIENQNTTDSTNDNPVKTNSRLRQ